MAMASEAAFLWTQEVDMPITSFQDVAELISLPLAKYMLHRLRMYAVQTGFAVIVLRGKQVIKN